MNSRHISLFRISNFGFRILISVRRISDFASRISLSELRICIHIIAQLCTSCFGFGFRLALWTHYGFRDFDSRTSSFKIHSHLRDKQKSLRTSRFRVSTLRFSILRFSTLRFSTLRISILRFKKYFGSRLLKRHQVDFGQNSIFVFWVWTSLRIYTHFVFQIKDFGLRSFEKKPLYVK